MVQMERRIMPVLPVIETKIKEYATPVRLCTECEEPIRAVRLKVVPNAKQCVPCLEALGDVPLIRAEKTIWPRIIATTGEEEGFQDHLGSESFADMASEASISDILENVETLDVEGFLWPAADTQPEE